MELASGPFPMTGSVISGVEPLGFSTRRLVGWLVS